MSSSEILLLESPAPMYVCVCVCVCVCVGGGEGGLSAPPLEFFILYFLKFVLIFGCAGSSLLHAGDSGRDA